MISSYYETYKIILFGDSTSGKKELLNHCIEYSTVDGKPETFGVDFYGKDITFEQKRYRLQILDLSAKKKYWFLFPTYTIGAKGAFILINVTNPNLPEYLPDWINVIREKAGDIPVMLVGIVPNEKNKRQISAEEGIKIAKSRNLIGFIECNTNTGENIEKAFEALTRLMSEKRKHFNNETPSLSDISLKIEKKNRLEKKADDLFGKLLGTIPEINSAAIASVEGIPIASTLPQGVNKTRIASMIAALLSLSERAVLETRKGKLDYLYIKGSEGYIVVMKVGSNKVLAATTTLHDLFLKGALKIKIESIIDDFLKKLFGTGPEVKSATKMSIKGRLNAFTVPQSVNERRITSMTSALLSMSERVIIEMKKGEFEEFCVKGNDGSLLISNQNFDEEEDANNQEGHFSYPYIFKPPDPPGGSGLMAPQIQIKKTKQKEPQNEIYCQYCGRKLTKEERFSHDCRKSPE